MNKLVQWLDQRFKTLVTDLSKQYDIVKQAEVNAIQDIHNFVRSICKVLAYFKLLGLMIAAFFVSVFRPSKASDEAKRVESAASDLDSKAP